ncbi:MAG: hypothetical protein U0359_22990 [Byssovorax sp.]
MAAPTIPARLRLVRVLHALPHRYPNLRVFTQGVTLAILFAAPLLGLVRFDLWDGRHLALRHPVGFVFGFAGLVIGIGVFYLITFVLNAVMGRVFCGFGCPIGQASRLGDDVEVAQKTGKNRRPAETRAIGFALALASSIALWFVSPRVFLEGSAKAIASTILGTLALAGLVYLHGRYFRWRFCEAYCPIGIYYSAVQTGHTFGIQFDTARNTCKECNSCSLVCPVGLDPRNLDKLKDDVGGVGIDGFPERNHCLTCGECVRACEHQFRKEGMALVPLRLSFRGAEVKLPTPAPERRSEPPSAPAGGSTDDLGTSAIAPS